MLICFGRLIIQLVASFFLYSFLCLHKILYTLEFFTKYIVLENGSFVVKEDAIIADGYGDHIEYFRNAAKGLNLSMEDQQ